MLSNVVSTGAAARKGFKSLGLELGMATMEIFHVANSGIYAGAERKAVWRGQVLTLIGLV